MQCILIKTYLGQLLLISNNLKLIYQSFRSVSLVLLLMQWEIWSLLRLMKTHIPQSGINRIIKPLFIEAMVKYSTFNHVHITTIVTVRRSNAQLDFTVCFKELEMAASNWPDQQYCNSKPFMRNECICLIVKIRPAYDIDR